MFAGKSNYVGIYLYVFPGTMDEIIQRKSGIPDDPNLGDRVFSGTIQLPTNKPDPEVFDLKFPFIFPFIYHPDAGQLVLEFRSGIAATLDAQGVVYDRGVHITTEFLGEREVHSGMFVTRFTYQTVFVQINSIHQLESSFEIEFTQYGAKEIELVGTRDPAGPYALDAEAKIEEIQPAGGGRFKAVVPNSRDLRFFRIRAS
jgi:hypothetical protein